MPEIESQNSNAAPSQRSSTSTVIYSQEAYASYAPKVRELLEQLFPDAGEIVTERMQGGGFNRVLGAKLPSGESMVIRIPRFDPIYPQMTHDAAVLRYLESLNKIPVPHVISFDEGDQNLLSSSYMIQTRVEGHSLQDLMANLTQEKRLEITEEVAKFIAHVCSITFGNIGTLCAPSVDTSLGVGFANVPHSKTTAPFSDTLQFLVDCFRSHTEDVLTRDPKGTWLPNYMKKLEGVARALNDAQPFKNQFCLLHNDFMARNILVNESPDDGRLKITAVLDWDGACAAPIEAGYVLPHWLWTWDSENEDGIMEMADETPATPELREVKELFEKRIEELVPGFMEMWRNGWKARELFYLAVNGFAIQDDHLRAERLIASMSESVA